jgi:hypothetical protein
MTPFSERSQIFCARRRSQIHGFVPSSDVTTSGFAFAGTTVDATGKEKHTIGFAAAPGEAPGDDLAAVTGTSLGKWVELDALAKMNQVG